MALKCKSDNAGNFIIEYYYICSILFNSCQPLITPNKPYQNSLLRSVQSVAAGFLGSLRMCPQRFGRLLYILLSPKNTKFISWPDQLHLKAHPYLYICDVN